MTRACGWAWRPSTRGFTHRSDETASYGNTCRADTKASEALRQESPFRTNQMAHLDPRPACRSLRPGPVWALGIGQCSRGARHWRAAHDRGATLPVPARSQTGRTNRAGHPGGTNRVLPGAAHPRGRVSDGRQRIGVRVPPLTRRHPRNPNLFR